MYIPVIIYIYILQLPYIYIYIYILKKNDKSPSMVLADNGHGTISSTVSAPCAKASSTWYSSMTKSWRPSGAWVGAQAPGT